VLSALHTLDLSRNALTSLEGLGSLPSLRVLNVYYNRVGDVNEAWWLRTLPALAQLDMRLNAAAHAPQYRRYAYGSEPSVRVHARQAG
jgi:hypothetical protein